MLYAHQYITIDTPVGSSGGVKRSHSRGGSDLLTGELDFDTFRMHGKPSSGCGTLLVDTTTYALKARLTS
jgi:hypothetical protein